MYGQQSRQGHGPGWPEPRGDGRWQPPQWRYARRGPATNPGQRTYPAGAPVWSAFEPATRRAFEPARRSAAESAPRSPHGSGREPGRDRSFPAGKVIAAVFAVFAVIIIYSAVKSENSPSGMTTIGNSSSTGSIAPASAGGGGTSP